MRLSGKGGIFASVFHDALGGGKGQEMQRARGKGTIRQTKARLDFLCSSAGEEVKDE
jgi:hypothetical protein